MVQTLHAAGIEVILDVVYNHTAEGNELGPTLAFRGIDNAAYYRLVPDDPPLLLDYTGCGNTLNMRHPRVLQLVMDSLRYWVLEMHVDGFRFDLASALARELHEVDRLGAFFDAAAPGPGARPGQADRRAVGPRRGRLPGRQLPRRAGPSGTTSTATRCARYWKGDGGLHRRVRTPPHRIERPLRPQRPAALREHQLRHRPRRLHAARPRQLQRQAQRGQRRGQPRRAQPQPVAGTAASKARPTIPRSSRCARGSSATCSRRCCSRRACRCCLPATSSAAPSGATTTPIARTTRSAGSTGISTPERPRAHGLRAAADRAAPRASRVPAPRFLPGPAPARPGGEGHRLAQARRRAR